MKILASLTTLILLASPMAFAEIYKYRGKDGSIVFSDQRNPDGADEVVNVGPANVVPLQNESKSNTGGRASSQSKNAPPKDLYDSITIVAPSNGEAIRANDGVVAVRVDSMPPLDVGAGDLVRLSLDGIPAAQGVSTEIKLDSLDRGEHSVMAEIIDLDGQILKRSESVTFQVLKHSVLFKNN